MGNYSRNNGGLLDQMGKDARISAEIWHEVGEGDLSRFGGRGEPPLVLAKQKGPLPEGGLRPENRSESGTWNATET